MALELKGEECDSCPQRTYKPVEKPKCKHIQDGNWYSGHTFRTEVDYGKRNPYLEGGWRKIHGGYDFDTRCWLKDEQEFARQRGQSVKRREVEESSGNCK